MGAMSFVGDQQSNVFEKYILMKMIAQFNKTGVGIFVLPAY